MTDYPVRGLAELDAYLSALPKNMQKGAYRSALTAAAAPIRDEARMRAKKKSGALAKGIKTGSARQNQDGTFSVSIRCTGPHGFLGRFFEYGVAEHFITAGDSGLSARKLTQKAGREGMAEHEGVLKIGNQFVSGAVHHPGFPAHPFMRPALDAKVDDALAAFAQKIRDYLEKKTGFEAPLPSIDEAA